LTTVFIETIRAVIVCLILDLSSPTMSTVRCYQLDLDDVTNYWWLVIVQNTLGKTLHEIWQF